MVDSKQRGHQRFTLGCNLWKPKRDDGTNGLQIRMMLRKKDRNEIDLRQGWIKPDDFKKI
jgi:hypothetical protein